jgi:hypothetical protein
MDITQLLANGGIITVLGGILYKINDRRIKKLEDEKVNKELYEERSKNTDEKLDKLEKTTLSTHDAVIAIKAALGIKGD